MFSVIFACMILKSDIGWIFKVVKSYKGFDILNYLIY